MHAFLLKNMRSTLSQIYNGCVVDTLPTVNTAGIHPRQGSADPPTTVIFFFVGINSMSVTINRIKCWGPARQILAPLSGNTLVTVDFRDVDVTWPGRILQSTCSVSGFTAV